MKNLIKINQNPTQSVNKVANAQYSTRLLAATTLRNILGMKTLQEILTDKEAISHHMQEILDVKIYFQFKIQKLKLI